MPLVSFRAERGIRALSTGRPRIPRDARDDKSAACSVTDLTRRAYKGLQSRPNKATFSPALSRFPGMIVNLFLLLVPLSVVLEYVFHAPPVWVFVVGLLGI